MTYRLDHLLSAHRKLLKVSVGAAVVSLLLCAPAAFADPTAKCGSEPEAPMISTKDASSFNASVDKFQAYEKAARAYNICVSKAASAEETAISNEARAKIAKVHSQSTDIQQRIAANFKKISGELQDGAKKLGKK